LAQLGLGKVDLAPFPFGGAGVKEGGLESLDFLPFGAVGAGYGGFGLSPPFPLGVDVVGGIGF
jgi:hypothetical protein